MAKKCVYVVEQKYKGKWTRIKAMLDLRQAEYELRLISNNRLYGPPGEEEKVDYRIRKYYAP